MGRALCGSAALFLRFTGARSETFVLMAAARIETIVKTAEQIIIRQR